MLCVQARVQLCRPPPDLPRPKHTHKQCQLRQCDTSRTFGGRPTTASACFTCLVTGQAAASSLVPTMLITTASSHEPCSSNLASHLPPHLRTSAPPASVPPLQSLGRRHSSLGKVIDAAQELFGSSGAASGGTGSSAAAPVSAGAAPATPRFVDDLRCYSALEAELNPRLRTGAALEQLAATTEVERGWMGTGR